MKGKTCIIAKFLRTVLVICSYSREGETPSYNRINMVAWNSSRIVPEEVSWNSSGTKPQISTPVF